MARCLRTLNAHKRRSHNTSHIPHTQTNTCTQQYTVGIDFSYDSLSSRLTDSFEPNESFKERWIVRSRYIQNTSRTQSLKNHSQHRERTNNLIKPSHHTIDTRNNRISVLTWKNMNSHCSTRTITRTHAPSVFRCTSSYHAYRLQYWCQTVEVNNVAIMPNAFHIEWQMEYKSYGFWSSFVLMLMHLCKITIKTFPD